MYLQFHQFLIFVRAIKSNLKNKSSDLRMLIRNKSFKNVDIEFLTDAL